MTDPLPMLTDEERAVYEWQMWVPGFGEEGQRQLKNATVLISRIGGLGGLVAYELAAAGVGRLILAHAGNIKPSDLNRQLLMTHESLGTSRVECAAEKLRQLNPRCEIIAIPENITAENVARLVGDADLTVCCAPIFQERLWMNEQSVRQAKPMIDGAMYEFTGILTTIVPGETACLACRVPEPPSAWKRQFPVFGAVSGTIGCLGAIEAIKLLSGVGEPLKDRLLTCDFRDMTFQTIRIRRNPQCPVCGNSAEVHKVPQ